MGDRFWWYLAVKKQKCEPVYQTLSCVRYHTRLLMNFSDLIIVIIIWDRHYDSFFHFKETGTQRCWTICLFRTKSLSSPTGTQPMPVWPERPYVLTTKFSFSSNKRITFKMCYSPQINNLGKNLHYEIAWCLQELKVNSYAILASYIHIYIYIVIFPGGERWRWWWKKIPHLLLICIKIQFEMSNKLN